MPKTEETVAETPPVPVTIEDEEDEDDLLGLENATMALGDTDKDEGQGQGQGYVSAEAGRIVDSEEGDDQTHRTYVVIVNSDGTLMLNPPGVPFNGGHGQTVIPVRLPLDKIENLDQPLVGAISVPFDEYRIRKHRRGTGIANLNGLGDAETPRMTGTNPPVNVVHKGAGSGSKGKGRKEKDKRQAAVPLPPQPQPIQDIPDIQLDPQDYASLEEVLLSEQGIQILENLVLQDAADAEQEISQGSASGGPLWDHSYSVQTAESSETSPVGGGSEVKVKTPRRPIPVTPAAVAAMVSNRRRSSGQPTTATVTEPTPPAATSSRSRSPAGQSSAESAANIRRSQRQQDRFERQEAERILAENKEMLQKEKEIMKAMSPAPTAIPPTPEQHKIPATATPKSAGVVTIGSSPKVTTVSAILKKQLSPEATQLLSKAPNASGTSGTRAYPKRENRKIPAHLADPNYVSLDDGIKEEKDAEPAAEPDEDYEVEGHGNLAEMESAEETMIDLSEYDDMDTDAAANAEDDPFKLWCVCRQPHNGRFMICCDRCEEWFHGKCVGVTKERGKAIEQANSIWHCPPCKKILKAEAAEKKTRTPIGGRRSSDAAAAAAKSTAAGTKTQDGGRRKSASGAIAAATPKLKQTELPTAWKTGNSKTIAKGGRRLDVVGAGSGPAHALAPGQKNCVGCRNKPARQGSLYCSGECKQKDLIKKGRIQPAAPAKTIPAAAAAAKPATTPKPAVVTPPTKTTTPPENQSPTKFKRSNSKADVGTGAAEESFLTFHVITPGSNKSTEVVPAKQKELTASALVKQQQQQQQQQQVVENTATKVISSSAQALQPTVLVQKLSSKHLDEKTGKSSSSSSKGKEKEAGKSCHSSGRERDRDRHRDSRRHRHHSSRTSEDEAEGEKPAKKSSSSSSKDKIQRQSSENSGEAAIRENMKKTLREILQNRIEVPPQEETWAISPGEMSGSITAELVACFGSGSNTKCKNKFRSIIFNLKDPKNALYLDLLRGNTLAKDLVRMESHQLASAELTEWRLKENAKELEAIKRSELDKLAEAKKKELIKAGTEFDKVVTAEKEARSMDITDVIKDDPDLGGAATTPGQGQGAGALPLLKKKPSTSSHSHSHGHGHSHSSKHKKKDKERERRHKDKDKVKGHKSRSSSESEKKRHEEKEKKKPAIAVKMTMERKDSFLFEDGGKLESLSSPGVSTPGSTSVSGADDSSSSAAAALAPPHSLDSEQELPSSTIKTPDFTSGGSSSRGILQTRLIMPELGQFNGTLYNVSHPSVEGIYFPEAPVPVVGRISPDIVWDYISKMRKNKEVIIFRLAPTSPSDTEAYMSFFTYLSARSRFGVLGGIQPPLKDVYLIPLGKHDPINRILLPFRGPGLPTEDRTHCLLAVVTRSESHPGLTKRLSLSSADAHAQQKRPKIGSGTEIKAGLISSLNLGDKRRTRSSNSAGSAGSSTPAPAHAQADSKIPGLVDEDDDQPYTPWGEEENFDEKEKKPLVGLKEEKEEKTSAELLLEELNARIEREKQEIESISVAISRNSSGIPGLDGEFVAESKESEEPPTATTTLPFFLRNPMPSLQSKPAAVSVAAAAAAPAISLPRQVHELIDLENEKEKDKEIVKSATRFSDSDSSDEDEPETKIPGFGDIGIKTEFHDVDDRQISTGLQNFPPPPAPIMDLDDRILTNLAPPSRAEHISINIRAQPGLLASPPAKLTLTSPQKPVTTSSLPFDLPPAPTTPKGKININLSTKILPEQPEPVGMTLTSTAPKLTPIPQVPLPFVNTNIPPPPIGGPLPPSLTRIPPAGINVNIPPPPILMGGVIPRNVPPPPMMRPMGAMPMPPLAPIGMPALTRIQGQGQEPMTQGQGQGQIPPMPQLRAETGTDGFRRFGMPPSFSAQSQSPPTLTMRTSAPAPTHGRHDSGSGGEGSGRKRTPEFSDRKRDKIDKSPVYRNPIGFNRGRRNRSRSRSRSPPPTRSARRSRSRSRERERDRRWRGDRDRRRVSPSGPSWRKRQSGSRRSRSRTPERGSRRRRSRTRSPRERDRPRRERGKGQRSRSKSKSHDSSSGRKSRSSAGKEGIGLERSRSRSRSKSRSRNPSAPSASEPPILTKAIESPLIKSEVEVKNESESVEKESSSGVEGVGAPSLAPEGSLSPWEKEDSPEPPPPGLEFDLSE